ncbi:MAG TPA: DNA primase [Thermodesulfovibrionales bacterium]|nr:DNA primase [Thermodesulfovibrionales bacterium]
MKSDRVLEEIKGRIDIVDFISDYVQLRKSGQNWKGLCPFHSEKTPSFMVSPSKQIFHCFGCGAGGDVISFLVQYEHMPFPEALQMLARKAGVQLREVKQDKKAVAREEQIRGALKEAAAYYAGKLHESRAAEAYIRNRGIVEGTAEIFRLGYAPPGWHNLLQYLKGKGYADSIIREAGLAVAGEKGMYDMFRDRIMFPIMGTQGDVIAFGGRAMGDSLPKYINSPETPVFRKSETLYGLGTAKEAIRHQELVFLVEGYMDVIICHQHGIRNVVAPLGTSLTPGHLQKLRRLTKEAVVVFDGDAAGIAAARRALPLLCQNDYHARVLLLPHGEDPDSYLRKHGTESFIILTEKAQSMIDFLFSVAKGRRSDAVREALMMIAELRDTLDAEQMLMELAGRSRVSEGALREEFRKIKGKKPGERIMPAGRRSGTAESAEERLLLSAIIAFPQRTDEVLARIDLNTVRDATAAALFRRLAAAPDRGNLSSVLEGAGEEERLLFTRLSVDPGFDTGHVDRVIEDCLLKIENRKLDARFHEARETGDIHLINALLMEKKQSIKGKRT